MSKTIGNQLPRDIVATFDGSDIESKIGPAYLLVTSDDDGTPRPCMLSVGEIFVPDDRHIRVALWPGTTTAKNLARGTRALFCYVAPGKVYYAKGIATALGAGPDSKLERFEITVDVVESDIHQGMPVVETILFAIADGDRSKVAADWQRQLDALRA